MPDIDFAHIRSLGPGGQRDGFEQFICQQVSQESPVAGAKFVSLHGAGGDGGVECYWVLPDDTEHGHQAKYWTNHSDVDKKQLDNSVKAALKQHPKLTKYTIAIPADPTGRTGRGKSLLEKINDPGGWLEGWNDTAAARGMTVEFEIEWATNIVTRLERLDATGIQRRYWFDADVLDAKWWSDRLEDAVNAARPRYMPELNVEVPAARSIAALCSDDDWWSGVAEQIDEANEAARRVRRAKGDALVADMDAVLDATTKVIDALTAWHTTRTTSGLDDLAQALDDASNIVGTQEIAETRAMDTHYSGENWDTASWRQARAEYMVSFPAEGVDSLRELQEKLADITGLLISPIGRLAGSQVALMTGAAGIGKTYLAIDAVAQRLAKGRPSVLMHGRWFTNTDPLMYLRDVLKMPSDLTSEDAIALLDESGRAAGVPTLLVIDALNDTRPRSLWRDNLDRFITTVERHPNIRLLLTARTHYVGQVIPTSVTMPKFEHTGFEGVEFEALSEYAAFYGLEPPISPPIHGEFDNPLYLRLVCEALKSNARLSLDQAVMGLDELTTMVLDNANTIISDRIDASPSDRVVHQAMHALASAIADAGGDPWLTRTRAQAQLAPIWSDRSAEKSLLDALISQGLVEEDVVPDGSAHGADIIAITFERIGHHLIVSDALSGVTDKTGIAAELGGRLGRIIGLDGTIDPGILEATSVVVAERFGLELTEFAAEIGDDDATATAVVAGTAWRKDTSITNDTRAIVIDALHRQDVRAAALTMLFRLAARPDHPLNADFLHESLTSMKMGGRDSFLPGWFHDSHGTSGAVDRLIRWAREKPLDQVGEETTRLWVTALLWTTSATDRRVREPATIAAARLLTRHSGLAAGLLERFTDVDDEWVVERACAAAYAALLADGSADDWTAAAEVVWKNVFSVSSAVTPNAAVRDAARSILEAAADRGALPAGVTAAQFRPPYTSDWPITWPTKVAIEGYDTNDYPKLVFSTTHDDFFIYQLSPELRDRPGIDLNAAARWVVEEVIRLGYRPEWHAWFDGYVLGKYGMGRSKPAWIERIGKKYQWIALNRLLGIVSDHVPKTRNSWDPPASPVPGPQTEISRQVDPTVVEFAPVDPAPRAWVPEYDWTATGEKTDAEWIADDTDLPTVAINEATFDGRPFVVLSGTYDWSNATDTTERTRGMWTHVYPHLVATADLPVAIAELENRDLTGTDLARPPLAHHGYVGEYPYGHHHGETLHVIDHEWREPLSVPTFPAAWDILGEYGYAPDELHTISLDVPAPDFFGHVPGNLHWNGRNGWTDNNGQLVAVLRHTVNTGRNELLVDADWLEQWLTAEKKSLIWIQNTGKEVYRGFNAGHTSPGALSRSLVQSWTPGSDVQTAAPGWYRLPGTV